MPISKEIRESIRGGNVCLSCFDDMGMGMVVTVVGTEKGNTTPPRTPRVSWRRPDRHSGHATGRLTGRFLDPSMLLIYPINQRPQLVELSKRVDAVAVESLTSYLNIRRIQDTVTLSFSNISERRCFAY